MALLIVLFSGLQAVPVDAQRRSGGNRAQNPSQRELSLPPGGNADLKQQLQWMQQLKGLLGTGRETPALPSFDAEQLKQLREMMKQLTGGQDVGAGNDETGENKPTSPLDGVTPEQISKALSDPAMREQVRRMIEQYQKDGTLPQGRGPSRPGALLPGDNTNSVPEPEGVPSGRVPPGTEPNPTGTNPSQPNPSRPNPMPTEQAFPELPPVLKELMKRLAPQSNGGPVESNNTPDGDAGNQRLPSSPPDQEGPSAIKRPNGASPSTANPSRGSNGTDPRNTNSGNTDPRNIAPPGNPVGPRGTDSVNNPSRIPDAAPQPPEGSVPRGPFDPADRRSSPRTPGTERPEDLQPPGQRERIPSSSPFDEGTSSGRFSPGQRPPEQRSSSQASPKQQPVDETGTTEPELPPNLPPPVAEILKNNPTIRDQVLSELARLNSEKANLERSNSEYSNNGQSLNSDSTFNQPPPEDEGFRPAPSATGNPRQGTNDMRRDATPSGTDSTREWMQRPEQRGSQTGPSTVPPLTPSPETAEAIRRFQEQLSQQNLQRNGQLNPGPDGQTSRNGVPSPEGNGRREQGLVPNPAVGPSQGHAGPGAPPGGGTGPGKGSQIDVRSELEERGFAQTFQKLIDQARRESMAEATNPNGGGMNPGGPNGVTNPGSQGAFQKMAEGMRNDLERMARENRNQNPSPTSNPSTINPPQAPSVGNRPGVSPNPTQGPSVTQTTPSVSPPRPSPGSSTVNSVTKTANSIWSNISTAPAPRVAAPSVTTGGLGGGSMGSIGGGGAHSMFGLVLLLTALGLAWFLGPWLLKVVRDQATQSELAGINQVRPADIRSRWDVVRAFHQFALRPASVAADWWTHRDVERQVAESRPAIRPAVQTLANLYEQARYLPEETEFTSDQIGSARQAFEQCVDSGNPVDLSRSQK